MTSVWNFLVSTGLPVTGTVLAAVALFASWRFAKRSHKLVFQHLYTPFISDTHGVTRNLGIRISKGDMTFERLGRTIVIIWNRGHKSLQYGAGIKAPIVIRLKDNARIVHGEILKTARAGNPTKCQLKIADRCAMLSFSHLNRHDGALLSFVHDGAHGQPLVEGELIDGPPIEDAGLANTPLPAFWETVRHFSPSAFLIVVGTIAYLIGGPPFMAFIGMGIAQAFLTALSTWGRRRRCPRSLDPFHPPSDEQSEAQEEMLILQMASTAAVVRLGRLWDSPHLADDSDAALRALKRLENTRMVVLHDLTIRVGATGDVMLVSGDAPGFSLTSDGRDAIKRAANSR